MFATRREFLAVGHRPRPATAHSATSAVAQVAEQKGIPLVINVASAPQITEQGYKFVVRNFPTAAMILRDAFVSQKEIFAESGVEPKSVVFLHINDTYGVAVQGPSAP